MVLSSGGQPTYGNLEYDDSSGAYKTDFFMMDRSGGNNKARLTCHNGGDAGTHADQLEWESGNDCDRVRAAEGSAVLWAEPLTRERTAQEQPRPSPLRVARNASGIIRIRLRAKVTL